jgi:hypothetical protein
MRVLTTDCAGGLAGGLGTGGASSVTRVSLPTDSPPPRRQPFPPGILAAQGQISPPKDLALSGPRIYGVPMIVNAVKMAPRYVINIFFAVVLCLAVVMVAAASFLGLTLAVQGWAANPPSGTIHGASQR